MQVVGVGKWARWGVFAMILALFLSIFDSGIAEARKRGKGRKGGAKKVRGKKKGRGKKRGRGRKRGAKGRGRGGPQGIPANGNANNNVQDFGPASINPDALGIRVVDPRFPNLGRSQNGNFFELNPGAAQAAAGGVVDPSTGVRQPIVSAGRTLMAGALGQVRDNTQDQMRAFNRGEIPTSAFPDGSGQVVNLRQR